MNLLLVKFRVAFFHFLENIHTFFCYWGNLRFMWADLRLWAAWVGRNPYRSLNAYMRAHGRKEVDTYGETPLSVFEKIAEAADVRPSDVFVDLGCGRGRGCFWLYYFRGCSVIGVDEVPEFIETARELQEALNIEGIRFERGDYKVSSLEGGSCYLYDATVATSEEIEWMAKRFSGLKAGVRVVTVSVSLKGTESSARFEEVAAFQAQVAWGVAEVFVQRVV